MFKTRPCKTYCMFPALRQGHVKLIAWFHLLSPRFKDLTNNLLRSRYVGTRVGLVQSGLHHHLIEN